MSILDFLINKWPKENIAVLKNLIIDARNEAVPGWEKQIVSAKKIPDSFAKSGTLIQRG